MKPKFCQGDLYELQTFYHRRALLSTRILCKREKLSGNRKTLGRNVSSVSRELRRNCTFFRDIPRYYPNTAQKKSNLRNSYRHRGMFWKQEVLDYIDEKLSQTWSPEQIAKTPCGMKMPSFKTIYRWIDEKYLRSNPKESAQERENAEKDGKRRKIHDGKEYPEKGYKRIQSQRIRALGSGYGSIGTREKQSMFCYACGEKNKILYSDKDPGQKGRNDGESDHSGTVRISERSGENHHMRQGERVCMLEGDRESTKL